MPPTQGKNAYLECRQMYKGHRNFNRKLAFNVLFKEWRYLVQVVQKGSLLRGSFHVGNDCIECAENVEENVFQVVLRGESTD